MNALREIPTVALSPDLQAQIARLVVSIPRPRYSPVVQQMLINHGLILEEEVAEMRKCDLSSIQAYRSRGRMPPHYSWGELVAYDAADIAALIKAEKIENAAYKRRKSTVKDLLK